MTDDDSEDRTIAEIRAYQRGRLIRSTPVRRAMTDTPKHYTITHHTWEGESCGWRVIVPSIDALIRFPTKDEAIAAAEAHRAAVVADSPELAQAVAACKACKASASGNCQDWCRMLDEARERIAALEAECVQLRAHLLGCHSDYDEMVRQRDAALARVRELKAAIDDGPDGWRRRMQSLAEHDRLLLEAAAQPKPRDESGPAPGWTFCEGTSIDASGLFAKFSRSWAKVDRAETWRIYDAEHGYAPPDEAAIRADERRRTDALLAEIALWMECGPHLPNGDERITAESYMARRIRQWPRTDAPAPAPAPKCTCAEDLRIASGMIRRVSRVDDPATPERCRIAAGYDAAAAWLDSPGVSACDLESLRRAIIARNAEDPQ